MAEELIQLSFSGEASKEVAELQKKLHAASLGEVVQDALGVLQWATTHLAHGDKIIIQRQGGETETTETDFAFLTEKITR